MVCSHDNSGLFGLSNSSGVFTMMARKQYAERWSYSVVHHSQEWDCWLVTAYDAEHDQIGDSDTFYRKAEAVDMARAYIESDRCDVARIYAKDGRLLNCLSYRPERGKIC